jgi:hypothetical protein
MNDRASWRHRLQAGGLPVRRTPDALRREIEQSGFFDATWYRTQVPGAAASGLDPLDHYLEIGARAGHSPGPDFDAAWYLRRYSDVAAAKLDPLLHFIRQGKREGREPRALVISLFDDFQSLGSNCEFGLVQRHFGCESLGLFRFATTPMKGLIAFLKAGTDPFVSPDALDIVAADWGEYTAGLEPYGFVFHSGLQTAAMSPETVRDHQQRRLRFLWRKLGEDLEEANRIFIYKSGLWMAQSRVAELAALLRRRGPNHLLWITPEEPGWPAGTVKMVSPGLMRGTLDRLNSDPAGCSFDLWIEVCRRAHRLWAERTR